MAEAVKAAVRASPAFKLGKKQVYLPNHIITLLRKDYLPPNEACFQVPLRFTKFDLRDYLWNLYKVEVTKVRSYVKSLPITYKLDDRSQYRPQPLKFMTVELAKPFQWPDRPTDLEPWQNEMWNQREKSKDEQTQHQIDLQRHEIPLKSRAPKDEKRQKLADLAKQMLAGKVKWSNDVVLDSKWDRLLKEAETGDASVRAAAVVREPKTKAEPEKALGTAEDYVKPS